MLKHLEVSKKNIFMMQNDRLKCLALEEHQTVVSNKKNFFSSDCYFEYTHTKHFTVWEKGKDHRERLSFAF